MKYTIEPILWKYGPDEHSHLPIYIKIYLDAKRSHVATGRFVAKKDWSEKDKLVKDSHALSEEINKIINGKRLGIERLAFELQHTGKLSSAAQLKKFSNLPKRGI